MRENPNLHQDAVRVDIVVELVDGLKKLLKRLKNR